MTTHPEPIETSQTAQADGACTIGASAATGGADQITQTTRVQQKADLRKAIFQRRRQMTPQQRRKKSVAACQQLIQRFAPELGLTVGVYSAMTQELSLHTFILHAYKQGARVAFPCMRKPLQPGLPQTMEFRIVSMNQYLAAMELQRLEREAKSSAGRIQVDMTLNNCMESIRKTAAPFVANPMLSFRGDESVLDAFPLVEPSALDQLVCPLVAFDANNNRLGYGGGNYDRYLPQLSDACRVVGVAFSEQQVAEVPVEEHDIEIPIISA